MAIEDKALLINSLGNKMSNVLTVDAMAKVMNIISDTMQEYEIVGCQRYDLEAEDDLLNAYLSALAVQGRSQLTIERYRYVIVKMMEHVAIHTRQITVYHLREYLSYEKNRGLGDSTIEGYRQVYSAYFNWLHREGLITTNPVANLGTIKCPKVIKKIYSEVDIELLKTGAANIRDKAIICFLASTGCRISELTGLNRDRLDLNQLEAVIYGKGAKERTVFMDQVTGMLLGRYLSTRKDNNPAVFLNHYGERIRPGGVRHMLNVVAEKMGVEDVYPHKFRSTYATNMIRRGAPIQNVASLLGHEKIDTTMRYIKLDKTDNRIACMKYA